MHKKGENNSTSDMHAVRVKKQFNIKHAYIKRKKKFKIRRALNQTWIRLNELVPQLNMLIE